MFCNHPAPRILAVFPEPGFRAGLTVALRARGLNVRTCSDSMRALAVLDQDSADLIVTALEMPPGNPHGFALGLMAKYHRASMRVLVLAEPQKIDRSTAERAGIRVVGHPATVADAAAIVTDILDGAAPAGATQTGEGSLQ
jgi:DNA-binding NtrC family response regulator